MIADSDIMDAIRDHCLIYEPRVLRRNHIRVDTKLLYPDGAAIALFVERGNLTRLHGLAISDFGKTFEKLAEFQVDPWRPISRLETIKATVSPLGVQLMNDRLVLEIGETSDIQDGIIRLSQACLRASCLVFTRRMSATRTLASEVLEIVQSTGLSFAPKHKFTGPYQKNIQVDYRVTGPHRMSSLLNLGGTHTQANEVLRKWVDLKKSGVQDRFVTVYDQKQPVERGEDLERLQEFSSLFTLGNRDGLATFLREAA